MSLLQQISNKRQLSFCCKFDLRNALCIYIFFIFLNKWRGCFVSFLAEPKMKENETENESVRESATETEFKIVRSNIAVYYESRVKNKKTCWTKQFVFLVEMYPVSVTILTAMLIPEYPGVFLHIFTLKCVIFPAKNFHILSSDRYLGYFLLMFASIWYLVTKKLLKSEVKVDYNFEYRHWVFSLGNQK